MTSETHLLCIIGCGGHARSVAEAALDEGVQSLVFIDANARSDETIFGCPVLTFEEAARRAVVMNRYIVALGDNGARREAFDRYAQITGVPALSVISGDARLGRDSVIGHGVFVGAGAYLGPASSIGDNAIINTRAVVEHESKVGADTHVAVGAIVLGRSTVGARVVLGAGAIIRDGATVGDDIVVGAGAVVTHDIDEPGIYLGVPARRR